MSHNNHSSTVTYVSVHLLPMSPVYTPEGRGRYPLNLMAVTQERASDELFLPLRLFFDARKPEAALQFLQYIVGAEALLRQQHHAMKP